MTIALATRGYLFPFLCTQVVVGAGPVIVHAQELRPGVTGAMPVAVTSPAIGGSVMPGPIISGGATSGAAPGLEPPSISGGIKPKIG